MAANPIEVALLVAGVLEKCDMRYLVGGSLASSVSDDALDLDYLHRSANVLESPTFSIEPSRLRKAHRPAEVVRLRAFVKRN